MEAPNLDHVRFFGRMTPEDRAAVAALLRPATFAAGDPLTRADAPNPGMYVIERGRVQVRIHLSGDTRQPVWEAAPGDVLGEVALAARQPAPVSAVAMEPTTAWLLDAVVVDGLRRQASPLAFAILGSMARTACARVRFVLGGMLGPPEVDAAQTPGPDPTAVGAADLPLVGVIPLFRGVAPDALAREAEHFGRLALKRGERLYSEGAAADLLYVVVRGAVETSVRRADEKRRLGIAGPGRVVGELAFMGARPHVTDATAKENAILLTLDRAAFDDQMARRTPLGVRLLDAIAVEGTAILTGVGRRHVKLLAERVG